MLSENECHYSCETPKTVLLQLHVSLQICSPLYEDPFIAFYMLYFVIFVSKSTGKPVPCYTYNGVVGTPGNASPPCVLRYRESSLHETLSITLTPCKSMEGGLAFQGDSHSFLHRPLTTTPEPYEGYQKVLDIT